MFGITQTTHLIRICNRADSLDGNGYYSADRVSLVAIAHLLHKHRC